MEMGFVLGREGARSHPSTTLLPKLEHRGGSLSLLPHPHSKRSRSSPGPRSLGISQMDSSVLT